VLTLPFHQGKTINAGRILKINLKMKKILPFLFLFITVNTAAQNEAAEDTTAQPAITAIGKPDGKIAEMKIGKEGGRFNSSDGKITLIIPEGAVTKKTNFSIQPITNLMPNANGAAYRLEPSGIQFKKPVQLIFNYDEDEAKDTMQLLLGIAMQDDKGQWFGLKNFTVDTIAKTLSGNINHFSDWGKFDKIKISPDYKRLKVKKNLGLEIVLITEETLGDELTNLIPKKMPWKATWAANDIVDGNTTEGKIVITSMSSIKYTAPATEPPKNPVAVTAELTGIVYRTKVNGVITTLEKLILESNILIYDDAYEVTMVSSSDASAGSVLGNVTYKDTGSFVVSIKGKEAKIIEKVNRNIPDKLDYNGKCIVTQKKSGSGNIHILGVSSIKLIPPATPDGNATVTIFFKRAPTIFPLLNFDCPPVGGRGARYSSTNAEANVFAAKFLAAYPQQVKFEAKEEEQTILLLGKEGSEMYVKFTVKQIKEE
jgi:hypothetical protein